MGVVIGETTIIGNDVLLYQGVVLGGTSLSKGKRHPTIEDEVVVGSGAKVMGDITIGKGAKIGAGSVVLKDVPAGATCVGIPGRIVKQKREPALLLEHSKLPDPVAEVIDLLLKRQNEIEEQIEELDRKQNLPINTLGMYTNAAFGTTTASFATQVELVSVDPTIGANAVMDSVVLNIPYFSTVTNTSTTTGI